MAQNFCCRNGETRKLFQDFTKSITPLLQNLFEDAIVTATVKYTINDVMYDKVAGLTDDVTELLQEKLDTIESGIKVVRVQLTDKTWPLQVDVAFQASHSARQESDQTESKARTYADTTIIEASGLAQEKIAEAQAYRTKVVASARANAEYLRQLLPEYRKHPELVVQEIYQDAIERIFTNVNEKFVIPKGAEWRILVNRDPSLKPKAGKEQTTKE